MSLLIDALKQAEAARAQAQGGDTPAPVDSIELEPLSEQHANAPPQIPRNTRETNAPAPPQDTRRARPASVASGSVASQAARELFEVKRQPPNRLPLILAAAGVALLLIGAGYVWWAIQPRSSMIAPSAAAGGNSTLAVPSLSPSPVASPMPLKDPAPVMQLPPVAAASPMMPAVTALPRLGRFDRSHRTSPARAQPDRAAPDEAKPGIRSGAVDGGGIQAAYGAYLDGNYPLARQRYQDVLRQDPRNVDAMNALGLIAWRGGQPDAAERMFRTAVQTDPKDPTANAQLALLYAEGDPTTAESRLRTLIAGQPASAAAYYALGSLLARQGRWNEAQQALFQAYTLDSDNPDVLFNLAVSLEHLSQSSVARQFYERALQSAMRRPASFDKTTAQSRVQALRER